ncbi:MAG: DJ-1/PfpI/YhbO family deglycase/protease [Candidatus Hydrothermarchaeales archaeon]
MEGKKVLMVIAPQNFRDEELLEPKSVFEDNSVEVSIASTSKGSARGMLGAMVDPDLTLDEVDVKDYDAVVVVGGGGSRDYLWDNLTLHGIVREFYNEGKVVAAICISPVVLAKAGLLDGKKATVFPGQDTLSELKNAGAILVNTGAVADGRIVTGRGPEAAEEFGRKVLEALF